MCNVEWRNLFPAASVTHLPKINSNHSPLLIKLHGNQRQAMHRPFHFQGAWFKHSEFHKVVQLVLNKENCLLTNNASLAITIVDWNKSTFGNIYKKKRGILARIAGIQKFITNHHNNHLLKLDTKLRKDLNDILAQEEILWYQNSREDWIRSGDRNTNTKYYHASTVVRSSRN